MAKLDAPFDLHNDMAYQAWREQKLATVASDIAALVVEVNDPAALSRSEKAALSERIQANNMAIYASQTQLGHPDAKAMVRDLGRQFGLQGLDHNMGADEEGVTELEV